MADTVKKETTAPEDKGFSCLGLNIRLNYVIFYWLGIGTLLPWNIFITVVAYSVGANKTSTTRFDGVSPLQCIGV